jgi:hypothetical protein
MTADQWLAALEAEGVRVQAPYSDWRTRGRDEATGKPFGPVNGVVIHHTAGRDSLSVVHNGTGDLPGPLCHGHLPKTGIVNMISVHRANHAGTFAQNAHNAVLTESSVHPAPDAAEPVDGNDCYYGLEIENLGNGTDVYPIEQYIAAVKWATAICRFHGWTEDSVIGHKEGTRRKIDPKGPVEASGPFTMDEFRQDVHNALALPVGVWGTDQEEEEVPLTQQEKQDIADLVWSKQITNRFRLDANGTPRAIPASVYLEYGDGHYDDLVAKIAGVQSKVDSIAVAGVDLDALAVKVADEIYKRMAQ